MASGERPPERFLPPDPRVEEPYRLTPQLAFRVAMIGFLALAVFAVLFLRLWALQMLAGDKYLARANDNRVRSLRVDAPRGSIVDRNGHVLVSNVAGTRLELWPADLPKRWPAEQRGAALARRRSPASRRAQILAEAEAARRRPAHSRSSCRAACTRIRSSTSRSTRRRSPASSSPGAGCAATRTSRSPPRCSATSARSRRGEYKQLKGQGYFADDSIGQAGVESTYDKYLRGRDGQAQLTVDSQGRPKGQLRPVVQPQPGDNLRLTIDVGLQRAAEKALRFGIQTAHDANEPYADGGAIVALDPNDGSVLAMASYPTYQPSVYVGRPDVTKLAPLLDPKAAAKANYPGLNRAIDASYPPGSTFKPVTALAAMQEHLMTPVRADPVHADVHGVQADVRQLDAADRPGDGPDDRARRVVRHVLLRARQALLHARRRTAAIRCRAGRTASGSASRRASTSSPRRAA